MMAMAFFFLMAMALQINDGITSIRVQTQPLIIRDCPTTGQGDI